MNSLVAATEHFLRQEAKGDPRYIVHLPRQQRSYLGLGLRRLIRYGTEGFVIQEGAATRHLPARDQPFQALRELVDPAHPCFMLVSSDLGRGTTDPELPLILCLQPMEEMLFKGAGLAPDAAHAAAAPIGGWEMEPDALFLQRLERAVERLQATPGKMIVTRGYQKSVAGDLDPLELFRLFACSEPVAACSHFLKIDTRIHSLGCSPENIFQLADGRISFDVVASTRGISSDPAIDRQWLEALQTDPKEREEHLMAFARYKARIEQLVTPGSLDVEQFMHVLQLGRVRHLHSKVSGRLASGRDGFDLMAEAFPPLSSYPAELARLTDRPDVPNRFYGGMVGRLGAGGTPAELFLNIRAALLKRQTLYTQGGVGVIAQSTPRKELLEVQNKLAGLMKAVAAWEQAGHPS